MGEFEIPESPAKQKEAMRGKLGLTLGPIAQKGFHCVHWGATQLCCRGGKLARACQAGQEALGSQGCCWSGSLFPAENPGLEKGNKKVKWLVTFGTELDTLMGTSHSILHLVRVYWFEQMHLF